MTATAKDEQYTRRTRIDPALKSAGRRVVAYRAWLAGDRGPADAVTELPTNSGQGDFLLCLEGQSVADVEAKKLAVDPRSVVEQTKRYGRSLDGSPHWFGEYRLPFVYSTNGQLIYTCDRRGNLLQTREITRYHTPDGWRQALAAELSAIDLWLRSNDITDPDRYYQQDAIAAIESAIRNGKRQLLVAIGPGLPCSSDTCRPAAATASSRALRFLQHPYYVDLFGGRVYP